MNYRTVSAASLHAVALSFGCDQTTDELSRWPQNQCLAELYKLKNMEVQIGKRLCPRNFSTWGSKIHVIENPRGQQAHRVG